jgi:hypothetical protein
MNGKKARVSVQQVQDPRATRAVKDWKERKVLAYVFMKTQTIFSRDLFTFA